MEQSLQKLNQHDRLILWTERVAACRSSGKSVRQWCQENGIAEKTYYYWQRRIFELTKTRADPVFAEVVVFLPPSSVLRLPCLTDPHLPGIVSLTQEKEWPQGQCILADAIPEAVVQRPWSMGR